MTFIFLLPPRLSLRRGVTPTFHWLSTTTTHVCISGRRQQQTNTKYSIIYSLVATREASKSITPLETTTSSQHRNPYDFGNGGVRRRSRPPEVVDGGGGGGPGLSSIIIVESPINCCLLLLRAAKRMLRRRRWRTDSVQGRPSGRGQPFVDIERRVALQYKKFILRQNFKFDVRKQCSATRWTTLYLWIWR